MIARGGPWSENEGRSHSVSHSSPDGPRGRVGPAAGAGAQLLSRARLSSSRADPHPGGAGGRAERLVRAQATSTSTRRGRKPTPGRDPVKANPVKRALKEG